MSYPSLALLLCSVCTVYWVIIAHTRLGYTWFMSFPTPDEKPVKSIYPGLGCVILVSWFGVVCVIASIWLIRR